MLQHAFDVSVRKHWRLLHLSDPLVHNIIRSSMYSELKQDNRRECRKRPNRFSCLSVWFRECVLYEPAQANAAGGCAVIILQIVATKV